MLDHNPMEACTRGERYEADVPDTLDLADRMSLAINALTNVWYPDEKWALGFVVDLFFCHGPLLAPSEENRFIRYGFCLDFPLPPYYLCRYDQAQTLSG